MTEAYGSDEVTGYSIHDGVVNVVGCVDRPGGGYVTLTGRAGEPVCEIDVGVSDGGFTGFFDEALLSSWPFSASFKPTDGDAVYAVPHGELVSMLGPAVMS